MRQAANIDEVLEIMDESVGLAWQTADPRGFFLALYRAVTRRVKAGIAAGVFEDGPRMDRLDTHFANRFFEAFARHDAGLPPTRAWRISFEACRDPHLCILQHLVLGMNAHINLDLGVSAAAVAPGEALPDLLGDFNRINDVLMSLLDTAQAHIDRLSPMLGLLDRVSLKVDEVIGGFSLRKAREEAWENAELLALMPTGALQGRLIERLDRRADTLGRLVVAPGGLVGSALRVIRMWEVKDTRRVIETLAELG